MISRPVWPPSISKEIGTALDFFVNGVIKHLNKAYDLPTYANNTTAKAGGLTDGMLYRTSTGAVMVVYT